MTLPSVPRPTRLPLGDLTFQDFERLCRDLVAALPSVRDCYRYGTQGDEQEGIDLVATTEDEKRWGLQCKQYRRFTRSNAAKAVAEATYRADRYILLLSCEATVAVRKEIAEHPAWEVWDVEDLSRRVRELPPDIARRVVETYFGPDWRKLFLGYEGLTPFASPTEYFRPWLTSGRLFNHKWEMVGRSETLQGLLQFARSGEERIAILPGRGGIGKSKLLQVFGEQFEAEGRSTELRFVVGGVPITPASTDELALRPYVIVLDDAHRHEDLPLLLALARRRTPTLRLVLSTRPSGVERILSAVMQAGFDPRETLRFGELRELEREDVEQLARQALGPKHARFAEGLAAIAPDSPLITVVGGQLIAEGKVQPHLLHRHDEFRRVVMDTFRDVLLGTVSEQLAPNLALKVLRMIAAVAPIFPSHGTFREAACDFLGEDPTTLMEGIEVLEEAGVLLRRGYSLRITPDVLADFLLEEACLTRRGESTGYAQRIYEAFAEDERMHILRNLAELDWRTHQTGDRRVDLLSAIWREIEAEFRAAPSSERTAMLRALADIAFYQPQRTLALIEYAMRNPTATPEDEILARLYRHSQQDVLKEIPPVLQRIGYNLDHTGHCCDLLWELGRDDRRETGPHPEHAIRVLKDLASYDRNKSIAFNEQALAAVERWLRQPDAHQHWHSVLDVLDPLLAKVISSDRVVGVKIVLRPFQISPETTRPLRERALAIIAEAAHSPQLKVAVRAIKSLREAARNPMPILGMQIADKDRTAWEPEQVKAFDIVAALCTEPRDPVVHLACIEAIGWHAEFGSSSTLRSRALEIIASVPKTFELYLTEALLAHGVAALYLARGKTRASHGKTKSPRRESWKRREERRKTTASEFLERYGDASAGFEAFGERVEQVESSGTKAIPSVFLHYLAQLNPGYAAEWCEIAVARVTTPLAPHLGSMLPYVRQFDERRYLSIARNILQSADSMLCAALAVGLRGADWSDELGSEHAGIYRELVSHPGDLVRHHSIGALSALAKYHPRLATDLALTVEVGSSSALAEELCQLFDADLGVDPQLLTPEDWSALLGRLEGANTIDGYHTQQLLAAASRQVPRQLLQLFFRRLDRQGVDYFQYRPLPFEFEEELGGFVDSPEYEDILRDIRQRALDQDQGSGYWLPELYRTVSNGYDATGLRILMEWINSEEPEKIERASYLLKDAHPGFVFQQIDFVAQLLDCAHAAGEETYASVCLNLLSSAASGVRTGTPGQPMARDVAMRDQGSVLANRADFSLPVRNFYTSLADHAEKSIRDDLARDAELLE